MVRATKGLIFAEQWDSWRYSQGIFDFGSRRVFGSLDTNSLIFFISRLTSFAGVCNGCNEKTFIEWAGATEE